MKEAAIQTQCMQLLRDLCIIARANGNASQPEREVLDNIAGLLEISTAFVCEAREHTLEPD